MVRLPFCAAATVGAVTAAAGAGWSRVLGASVGLGLVLGLVGGVSLPLVRRLNARALRAHAAGLTSGDPAAVRAVHLRGLAHDLGRSLVLALLAVAAGVALRGWTLLDQVTGEWLTATAVAGGLYAAAHGAVATVELKLSGTAENSTTRATRCDFAINAAWPPPSECPPTAIRDHFGWPCLKNCDQPSPG